MPERPALSDKERLAILETKVAALEARVERHRVRNRWIVTTLIALAAVVVAIVFDLLRG